jgi:hypothetical protein
MVQVVRKKWVSPMITSRDKTQEMASSTSENEN